MKLFKMFKRGQKGFTLVELMVVMAIMAVLATIVVPAVTGTKGTSENAQILGDINSVQSAISKFNNDSTAKVFPEMANSNNGLVAKLSGLGVTFSTAIGSSATNNQYTVVSWSANTTLRKGDGSLQTVTFVPDFVPKNPDSVRLVTSSTGPGAGLPVYVWVLKVGSATDDPTRTLEVYKTNDDGNTYTKVN